MTVSVACQVGKWAGGGRKRRSGAEQAVERVWDGGCVQLSVVPVGC